MNDQFTHFFKPEVRNAGEELVARKAVYLKIGSDTQIDASVKGTTQSQVALRSAAIDASEFTVDCSCKASAKGTMCKHIWATLLTATEKQPDFFENKTTIEKVESFREKAKAATPASPEAAKRQQEFADRQAALKQRAADARKQQYQVQKARAKERKGETPRGSFGKAAAKEKPSSKAHQFLSEDVTEALKYFELNGFPFELPINEEELNSAKRVLSRVFHPDKGGSQDEVIELLRNVEVLLKHT
jgi:uncharacterized Zn finger protein